MKDRTDILTTVDIAYDEAGNGTGTLSVTADALNNSDLSGIKIELIQENDVLLDYVEFGKGQLALRMNSERNRLFINKAGQMVVVGPDASRFSFDPNSGKLFYEDSTDLMFTINPDTAIDFSLSFSVHGIINVDWGDGGKDTVSSPNEYVLNHHYDNGGVYYIQVSAEVESYFVDKAPMKLGVNSNASFIISVQGQMKSVFPRVSNDATGAPMFREMFKGLINLSDISFDFFYYDDLPLKDYQFYQTFYNCGLTSIDGRMLTFPMTSEGATHVFEGMWQNSIMLKNTPAEFFTSVTGAMGVDTFKNCFSGCTALTSIGNLIFPSEFPSGLPSGYFVDCFKNCSSIASRSALLNNEVKLFEYFPTATTATVGGCYAGCTNMSDWEFVPANYK
jgi:hypothetical protein